MSTELQPTTQALAAFDIAYERIETLAAESFALKVKGIHDKRGLARIERARIAWHDALRRVERKRRELKAPLLEEIEKIDGAARQIRSWIEPADAYLREQVEAATRQRTQAERQAAEQRVNVIRERLAELHKFGWTHYTPADVGPLSDEAFDELVAQARGSMRATSTPKVTPVGAPPVLLESLAAAAREKGKTFSEAFTDAPRLGDYADLMHVANQVALIQTPAVATAKGMEVAREIETLLANCVDRIRAAADKVRA